jgi:fructose-1,6-bisphosphatase/inositol monophosphatase family enzyme|tara:strand:- start:262 stop:1158 length:897 start_codon:yes stop_codon:yes gene_type:complete
MRLNQDDFQQLCELAKQTAVKAGQYIASVDLTDITIDRKDTGSSLSSQVVTQVDRYCDQLIRDCLQQSCDRFELALLSEESSEVQERQDKNRFTEDYFWCVDPLDGTLPFTLGKPGYAVSIALVSKAGQAVIGVVYDPDAKNLYHAIEGQGAYVNNQAICINANLTSAETLTVYADLSFKKYPHYQQVQSLLHSVAVSVGCHEVQEIYGNGAVKNACAVLFNPKACYIKYPKKSAGGGCLWDFAATACIIKEAGGWVSDIYGNSLDLNRCDSLFMNHNGVVFCSSEKLAVLFLVDSRV